MDCHRLTVVVHYIIPYGDTGIYARARSRTLEVDLYAAAVCESSPRARGARGGEKKKNKYLSSILLCVGTRLR